MTICLFQQFTADSRDFLLLNEILLSKQWKPGSRAFCVCMCVKCGLYGSSGACVYSLRLCDTVTEMVCLLLWANAGTAFDS